MNSQSNTKTGNTITDSVIALNQIVLGSAASTSMAAMYITMSQAAGIGAQNSVSSQQHLNILGTAAIAAGTGNLLWEGLNNQVENMSMKDRLTYWDQMQAITKGQSPEGGPEGEPDAAQTQPGTAEGASKV
jgi:Killing trait